MLTFQCTLRKTGLYFRSPPSHSVSDYYLASLVPCPPKHTTLSLQKKFQPQPQLLNSLSLPDPLISHLLAHGNLLNKHLVNKQSPLFMFHCSKAQWFTVWPEDHREFPRPFHEVCAAPNMYLRKHKFPLFTSNRLQHNTLSPIKTLFC